VNDAQDIGGDLEAMIQDMLTPIMAYGQMGQEPPENVKAVVAIRLLVRSQALLSTSVKLMEDETFASSTDVLTDHARQLRSLVEIELGRLGQPDLGAGVDAILEANAVERFDDVERMQDRWFMTVMALIENMVAGVEASAED
jgi:hypothetical protein